MSLHSFRETINLHLFSSKGIVLGIFRMLSFVVSLISLGTIVYYYGFPMDDKLREAELLIIRGSFVFYVLNYFARFLYDFEPRKFLRDTWLECILAIIIIIDGIGGLMGITPVQGFFLSIGFYKYRDVYIILMQAILLAILIMQVAKATTLFSNIKVNPGTVFLLSFIILIMGGAVLLMLPEMSASRSSMDFIPALFTATSAGCVTGLTVVNTATFFSVKGKIVILLLIQMGGLNIISFATFFASFTQKGVGLKQQTMLQEYFSSDSLFSAKGMLRQIISMAFLIEGAGAILIFSLWDPALHFNSLWEKWFYSVFHSVSAFNNAGFSLFSKNLCQDGVRGSFVLHLAFAAIIFFGSLGFFSIQDIFGIRNMRERLRLKWKRLKLSTQISLYSSVALVIFGATCFYILEKNNTLSGMKTMEAGITSVFQSVTCRTAGFNTVDISHIAPSMLMIMIFLMFIGASSASTGGGIKTSTFTILLVSAYSTIRGKRNLELLKHSVSFELLNKAFSILTFSLTLIFFATIALLITDPGFGMLRLAFEEVSAFGTVGLSTGITQDLSGYGKIILILSMFAGRVGTLTLALALSKKVATTNYKYPEAHFMLG